MKRTPGQWQKYLDQLFSKVVRARGKCEKCGKRSNLQTSHIYSRSAKETRWLLENALCLCAGDHFWWHKQPIEAIEWLKGYLGIKKYEALRVRHRKTKQWCEQDYLEVELILLKELKKYGN